MRTSKATGTVHDSMTASLRATVTTAIATRKRKRGDDADSPDGAEEQKPAKIEYDLLSPLLAGKSGNLREKSLANVAPFWALLRASSPSANNMELQWVTLRDNGFGEGSCTNLPLKCRPPWQTTVSLPIAVNTAAVQKGELLTLPNAIRDDGYRGGDYMLDA